GRFTRYPSLDRIGWRDTGAIPGCSSAGHFGAFGWVRPLAMSYLCLVPPANESRLASKSPIWATLTAPVRVTKSIDAGITWFRRLSSIGSNSTRTVNQRRLTVQSDAFALETRF